MRGAQLGVFALHAADPLRGALDKRQAVAGPARLAVGFVAAWHVMRPPGTPVLPLGAVFPRVAVLGHLAEKPAAEDQREPPLRLPELVVRLAGLGEQGLGVARASGILGLAPTTPKPFAWAVRLPEREQEAGALGGDAVLVLEDGQVAVMARRMQRIRTGDAAAQ